MLMEVSLSKIALIMFLKNKKSGIISNLVGVKQGTKG
jgi:hypothetical protein